MVEKIKLYSGEGYWPRVEISWICKMSNVCRATKLKTENNSDIFFIFYFNRRKHIDVQQTV